MHTLTGRQAPSTQVPEGQEPFTLSTKNVVPWPPQLMGAMQSLTSWQLVPGAQAAVSVHRFGAQYAPP
jgi:hypothetical protein